MSQPSGLATLAERSGTKFLLALFVDLNGKPCAKLVPVEAVDELATNGVGFAGYAVGAIGQEPKDPDLIAVPDPASFTPIPFVKEGLALVHCDPHVNGAPWPFAPRNILKAMIAQAADAGFEPWIGAEVEYFLLKRSADGALVPADDQDTAAQPCYDARSVTRMYDHLSSISTAINGLGWGNYANDHEDGSGQFEQNFNYAEALTTCDRVITLRYLLNVMAAERGMIATFMPKPFADKTGSGLHMHISLTSGGAPVFPTEPAEDGRGLAMSATAYAFIAGILDHACAMQAVIAPTVNSYKRTGAISTASGASWAPRFPTYGGNDRTHYVRVPDSSRIELRGGDGSANPYLAAAVAVAAGLDGIKRAADPGALGAGPTQERLPATLLHAIERLETDEVMTGALDAAIAPGSDIPSVAAYFAKLKKTEFWDWHSAVGAWEHERYLTAF
ncbi:type III glutamate--ammonia ligase [Mycobacterium sp. CBMA293]|uniref:type III glutamate--ammonia ligase n=1 Tax=unclassified Mycolicibacterium TaxID=2636767 RepID=UPI0012DE18DD|nr:MULTISPECIES: type III glutamate--ammonia ligase [unclassified Mycolicibacterium]MUL48196.1 type III glutamate--ammonia ligase [Mycolicibacterium sp. CBMA 360]MUL57635.1 type III glutamate--ammonia ligase [Mycolicibacterium sp. CBMA 335]MUL70675.1 type III glutamate--ammonia ligase [Mycolicibacterium sp. CBMA 311]MUL92723.1 type III glutamate--ammonia ligase [Mycolicibacterium sp. CBMA 230]MUM08262.1 type III glutamate--ammonia ligase [Mycolicibacterium sp. CBMA 213]